MSGDEKRFRYLELENEHLRSELKKYKKLYEEENEKRTKLDGTFEQAKEAAKKGMDVSKDVYAVTKNVFGRAKASFKEEWDKYKEESDEMKNDDKPNDRND